MPVGFFFETDEITPTVKTAGRHCFEAGSNTAAGSFAEAATEARAVLEGQFVSMRVHAEGLGIPAKRVVVTGGASANSTIVQVLANVFGVEVLAVDQPDSASLGAAYRAKHAHACEEKGGFVQFTDAVGDLAAAYKVVASPDAAAHKAYTDMLPAYQKLEAQVVASSNK